jgi:hypothetical protein
VLGLDHVALCGLAAVARPGATVEALVSVVPSDGVASLGRLDERMSGRIAHSWRDAGLMLSAMRPATPAEVRSSGSSWARRLGPDRPVWRLEGVGSG